MLAYSADYVQNILNITPLYNNNNALYVENIIYYSSTIQYTIQFDYVIIIHVYNNDFLQI